MKADLSDLTLVRPDSKSRIDDSLIDRIAEEITRAFAGIIKKISFLLIHMVI